MGGSGSFASISCSKFANTHLISVIGKDYPDKFIKKLKKSGVNIEKIKKIDEVNSFSYSCKYTKDFKHRISLKTELNCLEKFNLNYLNELDFDYVCLSAFSPKIQMDLVLKLKNPKVIVADTIEFYIKHNREELNSLFSKIDGLIVNEQEAMMIANKRDIKKCGQEILKYNLKFLIIKRAEHGAILFYRNIQYNIPAFSKWKVIDPTGAGDTFIGTFVGYLASRKFKFNDKNEVELLIKAIEIAVVCSSVAIACFSVGRLMNIRTQDLKLLNIQYQVRNQIQFKKRMADD